MKVQILKTCQEDWIYCKKCALITQNKELSNNDITSKWKSKILSSEHSPIRVLNICWIWTDLPYWVSVHLVRHNVGITHFCQSQRTDIAGVERDELPQNSLVKHMCYANAQSLINISRKRLCNKASKETREAWQMFLDKLKEYEPEIVNACKRECDYRNGVCPEFKSCGLIKFRSNCNEEIL